MMIAIEIMVACFSITLSISSIVKYSDTDISDNNFKRIRAEQLKFILSTYFVLSTIIIIIFLFKLKSNNDINIFIEKHRLLATCVYFYSISRLIEIVIALFKDILTEAKATDLSSNERIIIAFLNWVEMIIHFSIIFMLLAVSNEKNASSGTLSAIDYFYFSVITSTTLGFGDITPEKDLAKLLTSFEVLLSMSFLILVITSYSIKKNNDKIAQQDAPPDRYSAGAP